MEDKLRWRFSYGNNDFDDAKMIREEVFVKEQGFKNEFDEIDKKAFHLVVYFEDKAIAVGRMFEKDKETMILGRIAVVKEARKKQIGRFVITRLETKACELGYRLMQLSAQITAKGFYEKLGYTSYGDSYYDEWCEHIMMEKRI